MGGLRKYMPVTYATMMIGALASAGVPGFSGFFSKDAIIEAVHLSTLPGSGFAYFCVLSCVFVTAFYTFRLMFMTFHGATRFEAHGHGEAHASSHGHNAGHHRRENNGGENSGGEVHGGEPRESPWVVTVPLIVLAIPTIGAGWVIGPLLFGGYFGDAIMVAPEHDVLVELGNSFHGVLGMMVHALGTWPFWLSVGGIGAATVLYLRPSTLPEKLARWFRPLHTLLENKYYLDRFNDWFFAAGARLLGRGLWTGGDVALIDGLLVNGSARLVGWFSTVVRRLQSGLIYHYAFVMIIGVFVLLTLWFARD